MYVCAPSHVHVCGGMCNQGQPYPFKTGSLTETWSLEFSSGLANHEVLAFSCLHLRYPLPSTGFLTWVLDS